MPHLALSLETLHLLRGGRLDFHFRKALQRAVDDINSSPDISDARKVIIELKLEPVLDQGELDYIDYDARVKGTCPPRSCNGRGLSRRGPNAGDGNQLFFEVDAQDNPDQRSLLPPDDDDTLRPNEGIVDDLDRE